MNRKSGILIAGGVLAALGIYFLVRKSATAGVPATGTLPANLASASGITNPNLSSNITLQSLPSGIAQVTNALGQPTYIETATSAPTASGISASQQFWNTLTPIPSPPSGWIIDPYGTQGVATLLPWRQDMNGNRYVLWGVDVYSVTGPDSSGNYTANPVAGTSSALTLGFGA